MLGVPLKSSGAATNRCVMSRLTKCVAPGPFQTGIVARDETEGMLATQIIATHFAAISALRRLKGSETVPQQDSNGNLAIKLLRTFTMQVEALHRYRGKGQQKVTFEHVHVNAGGQAIVGTVHPPDVKKKWNEPDAPREITQGQDTPLRSPDPEREPVQIPTKSPADSEMMSPGFPK